MNGMDDKIMNAHEDCDSNCPHLDMNAGYCKFYEEKLDHDNSVYGNWFMCDKCISDTY